MYCGKLDTRDLDVHKEDTDANNIIREIRKNCGGYSDSNANGIPKPRGLNNSLKECMKNQQKMGLTSPEAISRHCHREKYTEYAKKLNALKEKKLPHKPKCTKPDCRYIDCYKTLEEVATSCGDLSSFFRENDSTIVDSCNDEHVKELVRGKLSEQMDKRKTSPAKELEYAMEAYTIARILTLDILGVLAKWNQYLHQWHEQENSGAKLDLEKNNRSGQSNSTGTETANQSIANFKGNLQ